MGLKMLPDFETFLINMTLPDSLASVKHQNSDWKSVIAVEVTKQSASYGESIGQVSELICAILCSHQISI